MTEASQDVACAGCGCLLDEDTSSSPEIRTPCPVCGSINRIIHVSVQESMAVKEKLGMKGRHAGGRKPFIEEVCGDDLHRDSGTWMTLSRVIDRENDMYHEVIKDPVSGIVHHECREPLSVHRGHGAAKPKTDEARVAN